MTPERLLTLPQLQERLGEVLPSSPCKRTIIRWMAQGMPYTQRRPRAPRWFNLSKVLRWIQAGDRNEPKGKAS